MIAGKIKSHSGFIYIAMWVALAVIHFFLLFTVYGIRAGAALADSLVFNVLFALVGSGLWFMVRYSDLQTRRIGELAFYHLSGATVSILAWIGPGYLLLNNILAGDGEYQAFLRETLTLRIISGVLFYSLLVTIYYLVINYRELKEKSRRESELAGLLKEAELNLLRSQIRPHFLFNSLNSISSLTMTDPSRAQEMVIKLSELMRYSLHLPDSMMSTLEKELYHVQLYLDIEKVRFGDRLIYEKEIGEAALNWQVPVMILQPLLENAVKYGVYEAAGATVIRLEALAGQEVLQIRVSNSYDPGSGARKGTGTGLRNIRERLLNLYGTSTLMTIVDRENYFEVTLNLPEHAR